MKNFLNRFAFNTRCSRPILAVFLTLLSAASAAAQDFEAIERRLGGAVEAGEISLHQAQVMLEALRISAEETREREMHERRFHEFERDIRRELEAGEISEDEAEARLMEMRERLEEEQHQHEHRMEMERREREFHEFERDIDAALRAGKLTEQQAKEKLEAVHKELFGDHEDRHHGKEIEAVKRKIEQTVIKIKEMVEAGTLSEQDARKKIAAIQKKMVGELQMKRSLEVRQEQFEAIQQKVRVAVEQEKISPEQAREQLQQIRQKLFEGAAKEEPKKRRRKKTEDPDA